MSRSSLAIIFFEHIIKRKAIRQSVGDSFPLCVRLEADDLPLEGYPIPAVAVGKIPHSKLEEELLQENRGDIIGMLRAFLSDQGWALKAREGREKEI